MATAQQYAQWIVANQAKKGTPEFDTVAKAYQMARGVKPQRSLDDYKAMSEPTTADPTEGMGAGQRVAAGAGRAVIQAGLGARQMAAQFSDVADAGGLNVTAPGQSNVNWQKTEGVESEIAESKELDAPLMNTTGGKVGNVAGNVSMAALGAAIPGLANVPGAMLVGAGLGAAEPAATGQERVQNIKVGTAAGATGQVLGNEVGRQVAKRLSAGRPAEVLTQQQKAAQAAAADKYVLPPTQANPSLLNRFLEGVGGKIRTQQAASTMNQETTNRLAKQAVGLRGDAPLTSEALEAVRRGAGKSYAAVSNYPVPLKATPRYKAQIEKLGDDWAKAADEFPDLVNNDAILKLRQALLKEEMTPGGAIAAVRKLRFDAKSNLRAADSPEKLALGLAQRRAADAIDELVETNLSRAGQKKIAESYKQARVLIAKTHDVEAALNDATGNISARYLAGIMDRGAPLTGELRRVARFAQAFPKAAQNVDAIGSQPAISPLDTAAAGIGAAASGRPEIIGAIVGRPLVRGAVLSRPYQAAAVVPRTPQARLPMKRAPEIGEAARRIPAPATRALTNEDR